MVFRRFRRITFLFSLLIYCASAFADDPGITKVRLIQESDTSYIFELDISSQYLWTIAPPILPDGFRISDPDMVDQSGWITVKARITSSGSTLSPADELILPWERAGVDITVQWKDGSIYKGLFNRTLEGIHVPLSELMPVAKTNREVLRENFLAGIRHLPYKLIHPLLILVLLWAFPSNRVFSYLFMMTLGQLFALLPAELGLPAFELLFVELLFLLLIFLLIMSTTYKIRFRYLGMLLFLAGILHTLSLTGELPLEELEPQQRIQALFAFNIALDLGHYLFALLLLGCLPLIRGLQHRPFWPSVILGSLAIFLALLVSSGPIQSGSTQVLENKDRAVAFTYQRFAPQNSLSARQAQRGKGMMTTPVMVFLSIEPFEVRQEILVAASELRGFSSMKLEGNNIIPIESQEQLKKDLQAVLSSNNALYINDGTVQAAETTTSFVTLGRGGVATRETPLDENLDEAILGTTLIYQVQSLPDSIKLDWGFYPDSLSLIEASAVDPHGAFTTMLSPGTKTLKWRNRLEGYRVPAITAILNVKPARPLISFILWLCLFFLAVSVLLRKRSLHLRLWIMALLVLSFICYPFLRFQVDLPFLPGAKPSVERAGTILNDLLSNTYRAFDRRNESDVYDLLAISVYGEQLSRIYMQNRQAMALENRGGARANVDEVKIGEIQDLKRLKEMGYMADTRWTVRGSVNHFGHTHYRQNQYRALISFGVVGDSWKIHNIEILDTRRLY